MTKYITSYKELLAQCEAERAAAAEIKNLPELTGSEKQIAWALDIRARKFAALNEMLASMTTTDEQLRRKNQIAIQATKNVLASKTDSRFWIDNRNVEARKLIAANNLQDDLKAEFTRLATEASATEVDADEYAVSTEAQEVAINAEISAATANNTKETIDMTTMTDADKAIAERKTMTRRELFLEAKKEITYKLNARGAKIWYISYLRYDISGKYIGHTPALKCTRKEVVAYLRDNYCGLTVDDFLAEQKAWIDEETTKAIIKMNIDDQADHVSDKVAREVKACDDNDDVFALLPELDELNDHTETDPWFIDDPAEYTDRDARFNHGERHAARLEAKLRKIDPTVEVTYNINEYDEDTYYLQYDGIYRTPFALEGLEDSFYDLKRYEFEMKLDALRDKPEPPTIEELTAAEKDLLQEAWGRADNDIPQDYLNAIVAQTMPRKRREPITDAELIANGDELKAIEGRIMGRELPRFGQPRFDAPLVEWYREYQFRQSNPFWYEDEYHYLDDGTRIHAKK